jgi:hypothetical protein
LHLSLHRPSLPLSLSSPLLAALLQVQVFHDCCLWLLVSCLRPSNCLRLLRLGQTLSLVELEEEAFLYSLVNLRQVRT